jgi:predicted dehydrogenase
MSDQVLGAAIFGAGWVAGEHARAYEASPRTRLVAVGSRNESSARRCADYAGVADAYITTDFEELLRHPEVDLISITTPPDLHPELAIRAARAGKHLCIEKPIALDWESCRRMEEAVRETGVKSIVSFVLHWNPSLVNTRGLIDRGAIGKPYYIEVDYWHGAQKWYPQYPWSVTASQGGSSLLSAGCHAVDALRWFAGVGNPVVEVSAYNVAHQGENTDWEYDPTTVLLCRFADGTLGKVASTLDCVMPYAFNVDVLGTRGSIRDNRVWSPELFPGQKDWVVIPTVLPDSGDVAHHPFNGQVEALAAGILDGAPILPDLADAVKTHEVIFAADRAAREGRAVALPL